MQEDSTTIPLLDRAVEILLHGQGVDSDLRGERDLQLAMVQAGEELRQQRSIRSCSSNFRAPVPGWWPSPGDIDFVVESTSRQLRRWALFELRWCNGETFDEVLWDAVKLLSSHGNAQVAETYLIYVARSGSWDACLPAAEIFAPGRKSVSRLLTNHRRAWGQMLAASRGRPQIVPAQFTAKPIAGGVIDASGLAFEMRALRLIPLGSETLTLVDGLLPLATAKPGSAAKQKTDRPDVVEQLTASRSQKVRNARKCSVCGAPIGKPCRSLNDMKSLGNGTHRGRIVPTVAADGVMRTTAGSGKRSRAQHRTGKKP